MSMGKEKRASALAYARVQLEKTLKERALLSALSGGVLLALSGGADSALLFYLLAELSEKEGFRLEAMHVNHGIRNGEAERDEALCRSLCKERGVPFHVAHISVPKLAEEEGKGIEETARKHRYALLEQKREALGLSVIATAHNADDNLETVLLHLVRGTGLKGLCGIPVKRGSLIRPLLSLSKKEVYAAVKEAAIPYVEDSTNEDTAYTRNYIRKEISPRLERLNPAVCAAFSRMTEEVEKDAACLDALAKEAFDKAYSGSALGREALLSLPYSLCYRALLLLHEKQCALAEKPTAEQIELAVLKIQRNECFSLSFPGAFHLIAEKKSVFFAKENAPAFSFGKEKIHLGENCLSNGGILYLFTEKKHSSFENLHKPFIYRTLFSAKIEGELFVRSKEDGDAYRYGGKTRKLKKLFSDASVPPHLRARVPVLCDERGIVWVSGFGVREDNEADKEKQYNAYHIYYVEK